MFISKIFSPPPLEKIENEGSDVVLIETIGKHKVGFYKPYTKKTLESSLDTYTWNDKEGKKAFWHSTSHVMAQVLEEQFT